MREASHVVIDEAQDFGMMAYQVLHYCLRDCTYTIMGDTSQNIQFFLRPERLGGAEKADSDRHVRCVRRSAEELPEHGGDLRFCK